MVAAVTVFGLLMTWWLGSWAEWGFWMGVLDHELGAGLVTDRGSGDHQGEQPALAIDGQVPPAAGDLLSAVVAASGRADGIGALDASTASLGQPRFGDL
jgi:hypothetical protein